MSVNNLSRLFGANLQHQTTLGRPGNPVEDPLNAPQLSIDNGGYIPYQESPFALVALYLADLGRNQLIS